MNDIAKNVSSTGKMYGPIFERKAAQTCLLEIR